MACLSAAGFQVEKHEPDLRAQIGDTAVAFAVKRLRSAVKLERNLGDAARQIAHHGLPGFIVLDLSFIERIEKPIYVHRLEHQQAIAAVMADGFAEENKRILFRAAKRPCVLGVLLHASLIGRSIDPVSRFVSRRWLLCTATDSSVARNLSVAIQRLGSVPRKTIPLGQHSAPSSIAGTEWRAEGRAHGTTPGRSF